MTLEQIAEAITDGTKQLMAQTISKPWQGEDYEAGSVSYEYPNL